MPKGIVTDHLDDRPVARTFSGGGGAIFRKEGFFQKIFLFSKKKSSK